jgi:pimeloyl-ACP methyl ester carboxylesterase
MALPHHAHWVRPAAVLLGLSALLAGCGGGASTAGSTSSASPRSASPSSASPGAAATSPAAAGSNPAGVLSVLFPASAAAAAQAYVVGILRYPGFYQAPRAIIADQGLAIQHWITGQDLAGRRLTGVRLPTLVADGTVDQLNPVANDRTLAGEVPSAKLILYPGAGHAFLFQDMSTFLPAVLRFLDQTAS